jgi:hypothetical protein
MATVTIAASAKALNTVFADVAGKINSLPPLSVSGSIGPLSASFQLGFVVSKFANAITLTNNGVNINNLEITYNPLTLTISIALPTIVIGGESVFGLFNLPSITIIPPGTSINVPIELGGIFASSYSGEFSMTPTKQVLQAKGSLTTHQAHITPDTSNEILDDFEHLISSQIPILPSSAVASIANIFVPSVKGNLADKWLFHLKGTWSNFQLIDVGDTAINILDKITDFILSSLPIPSWAKGAVEALLQPVFNAIGSALDIGNDITNWLSNLFQTSFGLGNILEIYLANVVFAMWPVFKFEDPYPMIDDNSGMIAVLVPVENVAVAISAPQEIVISADIL